MHTTLAIIAALVSNAGAIPYIIDIHRGKTHPNLVTWTTYTLINLIAGLGALAAGEPHTAILNLAGILATGSIAVMGITRGVRRYTRFDIACQVFAIVGIILWQLTGNPILAVAIALAVDLVASLPTWHHAWIAPFAETWQGFIIGSFGSLLTIASLTSFNFVSLAFPILITLNGLIVTAIVITRRRRTHNRQL